MNIHEYQAKDVVRAVGLPVPEGYAATSVDEAVEAAFKIITSDPKVKGILVNIFSGIMRCDTIAEGMIAAVTEVGPKVRLEGTNADKGKAILRGSSLNVIPADDFDDAAQKIVNAVGR